MSPKAIRGAINKALKGLGSKTLKFTASQRLKIYAMIEGWRQELKIVEPESLQAEEIEESPAEETSTVDRAVRSLSRSVTEQVLTLDLVFRPSGPLNLFGNANRLFNCGRGRSGYCRGLDSGTGRPIYNLVLPLILAFD
jgi:hypothetical protein